MKAGDAISAVLRSRYYGSNPRVIVPNFTPRGWWECDVFEVTASGYMREYEIKVTRADFKADLEKTRRRYAGMKLDERGVYKVEYTETRKHEQLAAGDERGPKQFWFVVPNGLVEPEEVPDYAGLLVVRPYQGRFATWGEAKSAPVLHTTTVPDDYVRQAFTSAYHRCIRQVIG